MSLIADIKMLWQNRAAVKAASQGMKQVKEAYMKDGIQTTEFWGKTLVQVLTMLATLKPDLGINPQDALLVIAGLEAAYNIGRAIVKAFGKNGATVPAPTPAA